MWSFRSNKEVGDFLIFVIFINIIVCWIFSHFSNRCLARVLSREFPEQWTRKDLSCNWSFEQLRPFNLNQQSMSAAATESGSHFSSLLLPGKGKTLFDNVNSATQVIWRKGIIMQLYPLLVFIRVKNLTSFWTAAEIAIDPHFLLLLLYKLQGCPPRSPWERFMYILHPPIDIHKSTEPSTEKLKKGRMREIFWHWGRPCFGFPCKKWGSYSVGTNRW